MGFLSSSLLHLALSPSHNNQGDFLILDCLVAVLEQGGRSGPPLSAVLLLSSEKSFAAAIWKAQTPPYLSLQVKRSELEQASGVTMVSRGFSSWQQTLAGIYLCIWLPAGSADTAGGKSC